MVALAEFDVLGHHRHRAVGGDADEGSKGSDLGLCPGGHQVRWRAAHKEGARDEGGSDHQVPTGGAAPGGGLIDTRVHGDLLRRGTWRWVGRWLGQ